MRHIILTLLYMLYKRDWFRINGVSWPLAAFFYLSNQGTYPRTLGGYSVAAGKRHRARVAAGGYQ